MAILIKSPRAERWIDAVRHHRPDEELRIWPQVGDAADIEFAVVWQPEPGDLARYPNLRAVFSMGAGVDHILADPHLPAGLPIVRLVDSTMTRGMVEYVLHWVLHHHRDFGRYAAAQPGDWTAHPQIPAPQRRVGVMGLGELGGAAARTLARLGFDTAGWSRTERQIEGITCFHGEPGRAHFLARTEILVCLLPLTPATENILDSALFAALPPGAALIHCGRGPHLVEADLLAALDTGHLAAATLDVFPTEPLPPAHPFWTHPRVTVTPHMASLGVARSAAAGFSEAIDLLRAGKLPGNLVDRAAGY
ncbi:MAG: glyoxylate/hydroxypyruvate reductase A [Hyphomicrobiales bacterium]|nr:glyoxylate/hydroxypyruvate reductase A [Hyphomicrobiales bacterium]MCP5374167.1 glyoxylate/hydroxypyruvate reductase A [Hyphomicrobiales bacterium]